ncbi:UNKNOWN [Stylonychia lemnae]|uniref:tRNA (GuanineN(7))methyltransferase n=1 Tax=Stylonychia lemnae TaxID=5949 RepID=A0A078ALV9_STYLE|nr:UNKNOWN [Stylonychia lemnae]|eukprot:CDW83214.1 UNKNOWN [Stylonychia lemnae]
MNRPASKSNNKISDSSRPNSQGSSSDQNDKMTDNYLFQQAYPQFELNGPPNAMLLATTHPNTNRDIFLKEEVTIPIPFFTTLLRNENKLMSFMDRLENIQVQMQEQNQSQIEEEARQLQQESQDKNLSGFDEENEFYSNRQSKKTMFNFDAQNGLSSDKMLHNMDRKHPRLIEKNPLTGKLEYKLHPYCKTKTGWHCCTKNSRKSDFSRYGIGIVLYFQFLKHMTIVFCLMALLSIPAYIFFFSGNSADTSNYSNLKYILAAFSLGNIGQSQIACNSAQVSDGGINLYCPIGSLNSIKTFGQALISRQQTCSRSVGEAELIYEPSTCDYTSINNFGYQNQLNLYQNFTRYCFGKVSCTFPLTQQMIPANCTNKDGKKYEYNQVIYFMKAYCQSDYINVFLNDKDFLRKDRVGIAIVILDILIAIVYYGSFMYLQRLQSITKKEINYQVVTAIDFTVQMKNLPPHKNIKELKIQIWNYVEYVLEQHETKFLMPHDKVSPDPYQNEIMDIQFGLSGYKRLKYMISMARLLKRKRKQELLLDKTENPNDHLLFLANIYKINKLAQKKLESLQRYSKKHQPRAVVAYITFQSMNGREKFIRAMQTQKSNNVFVACAKDVKKSNHKLIEGVFPKVKQAPEPSVIIWRNLKISNTNRFLRTIFTTFITICILVGTVVALVATKYFQEKYQSKYNVSNCDYLLPEDRQVGLLACYCYNQLSYIEYAISLQQYSFRIGIKEITFPNGQKLCNEWFTNYTLTNAMIYAAALAIGIVILIVNAKIINKDLPELAPVFSGQFLDFSAEWYRVVGSTIMLAMIINIISPHFSAFFKQGFFGFLRWADRGFSNDIRVTKKLHQEDYEYQYEGIEFFIECRYAQIISTIYILMMYSGGMPLLYIIGIIQFLMIWYRQPPRYGDELSKLSTEALKYAVLVHMAFGFYMFSNSSIFQFQQKQKSDSSKVEIISTSENEYDELINNYCKSTWRTFFKCLINQDKENQMLLQSFSNNIYAELSGYDLKSEYKKTKAELAHYKFLAKKGLIKNDIYSQNFLKKLQEKLDLIQTILFMKLKSAGIEEVNDTMDGFFQFIQSRKIDKHHRLKSEYSYDIRDNHKYRRSRKGEKQVAKYLEKLLEAENRKSKKRGDSQRNQQQPDQQQN